MSLADKVAIVTGASRGIGKAISLGLAGAGAKVVVAARTEKEGGKLPGTIHATAEELRHLGAPVLAVRCDLRSEDDVQAMVEAASDRFGTVDILVNNAAAGSYTPFPALSAKEWDVVMAVCLRGPFLACKAVLPIMQRQGRGSIVNLSSHLADQLFSSTVDLDGGLTMAGQAYGAAKAGLERLSRGLAAELGKSNIAVNCVKPHRPVLTEGLRMQRGAGNLSGWVGPETMVKAVLFLASQDASGVSGLVTTDEEIVSTHGV